MMNRSQREGKMSNHIDHAGAYRIAVPLGSKLAKADMDRLTDAVRRAQDDVLSGGFALNDGDKTSITFFRDAENDMEFIASNFTDVAKRDVGAAAMLQLAGEIVDTRIENEHLREIVKTLRGESGMQACVDNLGSLSAAFKRGFDGIEHQSRSQREVSNHIEVAPAETLEEYRVLLGRWRAADGTATSSDIDESERSLAAKEVEAVSGALRRSPFELDAQGKLARRNMSSGQADMERVIAIAEGLHPGLAFRTEHGLHIEQADAADRPVDSSGPTP